MTILFCGAQNVCLCKPGSLVRSAVEKSAVRMTCRGEEIYLISYFSFIFLHGI